MAAPTPSVRTDWNGYRGMTRYYIAWTAGNPDELADASVVDISALSPAPTSIKIRRIQAILNGNVQLDFEFDAATDQLIDTFIGQSDVSFDFCRDYSDNPNGGFVSSNTAAASFTGDLLLTTTGAANGDELMLLIVFEKSSG